MVDEKLKNIVKEFKKEMVNKSVPHYVVGIVLDIKNKPALEIVVQRPERYTNPEIIKKIPKVFRGLEVQIA